MWDQHWSLLAGMTVESTTEKLSPRMNEEYDPLKIQRGTPI